MSEIRATLEEIKNITQEIKELHIRKKKLENKVMEYLETNHKQGVRLENIVFLRSEKRARFIQLPDH